MALDLLLRGGAVIDWGERLSLGQPRKALLIFAVSELSDPGRVRWSPAQKCQALINSGNLVPGSAEAILAHYQLDLNPIGTPPDTVWHGFGPQDYSSKQRDGWIPCVADGLTGKIPLAVAYADVFCMSDWRADEFADYVLR